MWVTPSLSSSQEQEPDLKWVVQGLEDWFGFCWFGMFVWLFSLFVCFSLWINNYLSCSIESRRSNMWGWECLRYLSLVPQGYRASHLVARAMSSLPRCSFRFSQAEVSVKPQFLRIPSPSTYLVTASDHVLACNTGALPCKDPLAPWTKKFFVDVKSSALPKRLNRALTPSITWLGDNEL